MTSIDKITADTLFDLGLGLDGTHALITGGCGLIGKEGSKSTVMRQLYLTTISQSVVHAFLSAGANVTVGDISASIPFDLDSLQDRLYIHRTDIRLDDQIEQLFDAAERKFGPVEVCVALASLDLSVLPQSESGICDLDSEVWRTVFDINVNGTFLTCRRWLRGVREAVSDPERAAKLKNVSCIIVGSEAGRFGVRTQPAYAAAKSAVQYGLLQSLAQDVPRIYSKARINAVAPGAVDTARFREECERYGETWKWVESQANVGLARPVPVDDVARTIVFLASETYSGSTHGQLLNVDGGKTGSLCWTREDLAGKSSRNLP